MTTTTAALPIGNRLRSVRRQKGMRMLDVAEILDVDETTISRWEIRKGSVPDLYKIQLAALFGCPVGDLFMFTAPDVEDPA